MPWKNLFAAGWLIVGMNHYRINGRVSLFCAMVREGRCIKAKGTNSADVFADLEKQAGLMPLKKSLGQYFEALPDGVASHPKTKEPCCRCKHGGEKLVETPCLMCINY